MCSLEFGKIIKEARVKQGLSQQTLANKSGVTKRSIIYWESGKRKMTVDNADKIFKALNMTVTIGVSLSTY